MALMISSFDMVNIIYYSALNRAEVLESLGTALDKKWKSQMWGGVWDMIWNKEKMLFL